MGWSVGRKDYLLLKIPRNMRRLADGAELYINRSNSREKETDLPLLE